jgi:hypothetical protein
MVCIFVLKNTLHSCFGLVGGEKEQKMRCVDEQNLLPSRGNHFLLQYTHPAAALLSHTKTHMNTSNTQRCMLLLENGNATERGNLYQNLLSCRCIKSFRMLRAPVII